MAYNIPVAVAGSGDPAAEFNAARDAILDLETRDIPPLSDTGWGIPGYAWWSSGDTAIGNSANTTVGNFWGNIAILFGPITLKGLRIHITTASPTAGATMRLGAYRLSGTTGTLMVDAGTVTIDSTGAKAITGLTTALAPGQYMIGGVPTAMNFSFRQHTYRPVYAMGFDMNPDPRPPRSYHFPSAGTGALPSSLTSLSRHQDWSETFVGTLMNW